MQGGPGLLDDGTDAPPTGVPARTVRNLTLIWGCSMVCKALVLVCCATGLWAQPFAKGMVVSQERQASQVGACVLREGGNAVDAAVAVAFALAVTHPEAGNLGGGGFLLLVKPEGEATFVDFREKAPRRASSEMFLEQGVYSPVRHHKSMLAVGVPGTVAGLHQAWKAHGTLPWDRLMAPAIRLAREGFPISDALARSLEEQLPHFKGQAAALRQFSRKGKALRPGERLRQLDLAATLARIAQGGPDAFYRGKTARMLVKAVQGGGGLMTLDDLAAYQAVIRKPLRGTYRGYEVIAAPPPSSGGQVLLESLNILEGFELGPLGRTSASAAHLVAEATRRAFHDRALHLGDPDCTPTIPMDHLLSKDHAEALRATVDPVRASRSDLKRGVMMPEGEHTTHLSVVDRHGWAVALTYTLEDSFGVQRVVPGAGFLLNNEMGDFNAGPGLTDAKGLIGTTPNLAAPGKRMLSSMCPVVVRREGRLVLVSGSPGGRTIPSTVLWSLVGVLDFGLDAQGAVDAPRAHHGWFPDVLMVEPDRWPEGALERMGHHLSKRAAMGKVQMIRVCPTGALEGGADTTRWPESAVAQE